VDPFLFLCRQSGIIAAQRVVDNELYLGIECTILELRQSEGSPGPIAQLLFLQQSLTQNMPHNGRQSTFSFHVGLVELVLDEVLGHHVDAEGLHARRRPHVFQQLFKLKVVLNDTFETLQVWILFAQQLQI